MRVGSLFSGIGGIELGFERAGGFETAWFVENDPHAQAVLRKHWPDAAIYDDVTTVDFTNVPRIDILTGGFPCQDISNAGKRAGIEGSRSGLWSHCVRAVRDLRPRLAMFENVSALTRRGLDAVLCDLAAIGYDAEWYCVPAAAVGAPHRRDRIAILAYPDSCMASDGGQRSDTPRESTVGGDERSGSDRDAREESSRGTREDTIVADTNGIGCVHGQVEEQSDRGRESSQRDAWKSGPKVAHSCGTRLERKQPEEGPTAGRGWWAVEPNVGRVANGVPHRVDRIKRLGNAVVPQWAEAIARAVKEVEGW